jgi:small subunit ribosomal protein S1
MIHNTNIIATDNQKKFRDRYVPHLQNLKQPEEDFISLFNDDSGATFSEHRVVRGIVTQKTKTHIIVDINAKNECAIPIAEFQLDRNQEIPNVGDSTNVYIDSLQNNAGKTVLSKEKAIREEAWIPVEQALNNNLPVKGVIFGQIKGGLTVDLGGIVAFLPGSQIDSKPVKDVSPLMNILQNFYVLKMNKKLGNIIVSRRKVLEEARSEEKAELLQKIKVGMKLQGTVKNITDYGAFIDLGSTDGLVHITDISWKRINHPAEVLNVGQQVDVVVIDITAMEGDGKRISLGIKQADDTPWKKIKEEFPEGKVLVTKITSLTNYGIFVDLKDGVDGLIHTSQLSWNKIYPQDIKNKYKIGDEIKCIVVNIDDAKYRISLGAKQFVEKPTDEFIKQHPVGSIVERPIKSIASFGIFVQLSNGMVGLIHESDIPEKGFVTNPKYKIGNVIECKVLNYDTERNRITLTITNQGVEHDKNSTKNNKNSSADKYEMNSDKEVSENETEETS